MSITFYPDEYPICLPDPITVEKAERNLNEYFVELCFPCDVFYLHIKARSKDHAFKKVERKIMWNDWIDIENTEKYSDDLVKLRTSSVHAIKINEINK